MAQPFDPYRALGVRRDATDAEVKAAHRKLAKRFHPDRDGGDRERFLKVQEAYRLLTDALARKEWDEKHAPGPMRAHRPSPGASPAAKPRAPRRPARPRTEPEQEAPPAYQRDQDEPASRRPRSSRAYTWSAAEVPWWEEGASENRRQPGRKRPSGGTGSGSRAPHADEAAAATSAAGAGSEPPSETANPFDVYNRSSGAAWSMAARAYFRRGDQDLPRRGQWQYEGTQVLTGARARSYAEAEARRRAAQSRREPATATAAAAGATAGATGGASAYTYTTASAGVSHDAYKIHEVRQAWQKRTSAAGWPSLRQRLLYALVAWIPIAIVIGYGGATVTGCDVAAQGCPRYLETGQAIGIALALGLLVALPKVAYFGSLAGIGALAVGIVLVAVISLGGVPLPLRPEVIAVLGAALGLAYVATVGIVLLRGPRSRPWYTGQAGATS